MSKKFERRSIKILEVREAEEGDAHIGTLTGYAAVFESDSVDFGGWKERIAKGAFTRSLEEQPDVFALWSHNSAAPLARAPETLTINEDDKGLKVEIKLVDTARNRDLLMEVRSGIIDSMSFGFVTRKQQWEELDDGSELRTLIDVELYEVSPVVWPAYPDTSIASRSRNTFHKAKEGQPEMRSLVFKGDEPELKESNLDQEEDSVPNLTEHWEARLRLM